MLYTVQKTPEIFDYSSVWLASYLQVAVTGDEYLTYFVSESEERETPSCGEITTAYAQSDI